MATAKGSANARNIIQTGKNSLLPPRSPFPSISPPYSEYSSNSTLGSKVNPRPKDCNSYHQRTSSESVLEDEQPSWLDDLLNEPETPVRRGHRRSSSDSFAYMDMAGISGISSMDRQPTLPNENNYKNLAMAQLWGSQNIDPYKDIQHGRPYADPNSLAKARNSTGSWLLNSATHPGTLHSSRDNNSFRQNAGSLSVPKEADPYTPVAEKWDHHGEPGLTNSRAFPEKDGSHAKIASENDTKRAKQQFAQRSRVRKLQYIAELETNVHALEAEGSEVSAEIEFLNQQHMIMAMENKALKQRLESLAQEQLIKYMEHEVLEKEIGRLRSLYKQQQQPQPQQQHQRKPPTTLRRTNSKDLDSQLANLSLKHKDASSGADTVRT